MNFCDPKDGIVIIVSNSQDSDDEEDFTEVEVDDRVFFSKDDMASDCSRRKECEFRSERPNIQSWNPSLAKIIEVNEFELNHISIREDIRDPASKKGSIDQGCDELSFGWE